jgi:phosphatidylethanolamine-binding protein (PEBP) family uncharacterized protein
MALLGTLLRNSRPHERHYAWNHPRLAAPETVTVTSRDFTHERPLDSRHAGKSVGGENLSPQLSWSNLPDATAELLLLIEDLDSPIGSRPPVHGIAIIDPGGLQTPNELPTGALSHDNPGPGVTLLRPTFGRGWVGPRPLKGHGIHRYVFQIYALGEVLSNRPDRDALLKSRPRVLLDSISSRVLARGRITGTHER